MPAGGAVPAKEEEVEKVVVPVDVAGAPGGEAVPEEAIKEKVLDAKVEGEGEADDVETRADVG